MSGNEPLSRTKSLSHAPLSCRHLRGCRGSRADRAAEERTGEQTTGRSAAATRSKVTKQQHEVTTLSPLHFKHLLIARSHHTFSPSRAQSVRRTSLRDKTLTTKKDAVEETRLRLRAQEVRMNFFHFQFVFLLRCDIQCFANLRGSLLPFICCQFVNKSEKRRKNKEIEKKRPRARKNHKRI